MAIRPSGGGRSGLNCISIGQREREGTAPQDLTAQQNSHGMNAHGHGARPNVSSSQASEMGGCRDARRMEGQEKKMIQIKGVDDRRAFPRSECSRQEEEAAVEKKKLRLLMWVWLEERREAGS